MNLAALRARLAAVQAEQRSIHATAGAADLTPEQETRWSELDAEVETLGTQITEAEASEARTARVNEARKRFGATVVPAADSTAEALNNVRNMTPVQRRDAVLRANEGRVEGRENQEHFERILRRHQRDEAWATNLLARSSEVYAEAWSKMMTGRADLLTVEERAAIAVGTNTAGGYLVPTFLDPSLIFTNAGSDDPLRQYARVVTLTTGNTWHGVTTAGATFSYDGELVEVSDDTPAITGPSISIFKGQGFIQASIEAFEDIDSLSSDVAAIAADARDTLDGTIHISGTGSGQPEGLFHAVNASSSRQVVSTTAAAIGLVDIQAVRKKVKNRWRRKSSWVMEPTYLASIQALGTALGNSYTSNLADPLTDKILGRPVIETDDAPSTQTTTALDQEILFGDLSQYILVDKPGSTSMEFVPMLFNTNNNLPDGRRGWYVHWRHGAGVVNLAAFALLVDKTSA